MKFVRDVDPKIRTFLLTAVAISAPAGETGFQLGAWGEVLYNRPMGAWAVVTGLLLALLLVPRQKLPVPAAYLLVLVVPSAWLILKMFMMESTGGEIMHPVLFLLGVASYLVCLPFAFYLVIKIINPDLLDLKGLRPKLSLLAVLLTMFLIGFGLGRYNNLFVHCEDFILAGDTPPVHCRPASN